METPIKNYGVTATVIVMAVVLSGCGPSTQKKISRFEVYRNSRYNFEFPYPAEWITGIEPANRDGQAFSEPNNPDIQIRGWASYLGPRDEQSKEKNPDETALLKKNFTTQQGETGNLNVEIGTEISSITLTLRQANIQYNWRGQTPNQKFSQYYPMFYSLAGQYKINTQSQ